MSVNPSKVKALNIIQSMTVTVEAKFTKADYRHVPRLGQQPETIKGNNSTM